MPSTTLYLIRHGEADESGEDDPGLTDLGRRQATAVGRRLRATSTSAVLHSPRRRATETAAIVADLLPLAEPALTPAADDVTPFPQDWTTVPERYHNWLRQTPNEVRDPGARRLDAALAELGRVGAADCERIVVTHNFVIAWFVRHALDAPWWRWIGLNQANGGLTVIRFHGTDPPRLLAFNDTQHLERLQRGDS
ncbi:MAG: histidine phosphatase family protein [Actinomycetota bacterium]